MKKWWQALCGAQWETYGYYIVHIIFGVRRNIDPDEITGGNNY